MSEQKRKDRILVLGDIHGRDCWMDIIKKETDFNKVIFLGDYVSTHNNISEEEQINNLDKILTYKIANPDKVILLRGNHDLQHLGYRWAGCSGLFPSVQKYMMSIKDRFLTYTQWIYIYKDTVFSHAGISSKWLENQHLALETINNEEPSEKFGFIPADRYDYYGDSITQPCTWIRPNALATCNVREYNQVVGHTPVRRIFNAYKDTVHNKNIWLCDCLPKMYLVIEDDTFIAKYNKDYDIVLPNRYGDINKLIFIGNNIYRLECCNDSYLNVITNNDIITAIDPSGGPFISVGKELDDMTVERIYKEDSNYYVKFK